MRLGNDIEWIRLGSQVYGRITNVNIYTVLRDKNINRDIQLQCYSIKFILSWLQMDLFICENVRFRNTKLTTPLRWLNTFFCWENVWTFKSDLPVLQICSGSDLTQLSLFQCQSIQQYDVTFDDESKILSFHSIQII